MSTDEFPDFATLRSAVFRVIHGQVVSERAVSRLISLIQCLPGDLPAPYTQCTDDFRDDFSPTAIAFILDTDGHRKIGALLNSVLDSYCSLFLRVLTDGRFDIFLEAAVKMFNMYSNRIYASAPLFGFWPTSTRSPFFLTKLELVSSSNILYDLRDYFSTGCGVGLRHACSILGFLNAVRDAFSDDHATIYSEIVGFLLSQVGSLAGNSLRTIDETYISKLFALMKSVSPLHAEALQDAKLELGVKLVKSPYLRKRFAGLTVLSKGGAISGLLRRDSVVDALLEDLHEELIPGFISLLQQLIAENLVTGDHVGKFWAVSVSQPPSLIAHYFHGWELLVPDVSEGFLNLLCDFFDDGPAFPEASLPFLQKIQYRASYAQCRRIASSLLRAFEAVQLGGPRRLAIETIAWLVPAEDPEWHDSAYRSILAKYEVHLQLQLLLKFAPTLSPFRVRQWWAALLGLEVTRDIGELFLNCAASLLQKVGDLPSSEFFTLTKPLLETLPKQVCECYAMLPAGDRLRTLCSVESLSDCVVDEIRKQAVDLDSPPAVLCELLFRTNDQRIVAIVVGSIRTSDQLMSFLPVLLSNLENPGSLSALAALIHKFEDPLEKSSVRFVHPEDLVYVRVVGDWHGTVVLPRFLGVEVFRGRVQAQLERAVACSVTELEDGGEVSVVAFGPTVKPSTVMPSVLLGEYREKLIGMLDESATVLDILLEMPLETAPGGLDLKMSDFRLLYELNLVGSWVLKNQEWKEGFINEGGAKELLLLLMNGK